MRQRYFSVTLFAICLTLIVGFSGQQNSKNGKELYEEHCQSCHMKMGKGFLKMYPPLTDTTWVGRDEKIVGNILNGLKGEIIVNGKTYDKEMPPMAYLTNEEIAAIINYIRKEIVGVEANISAKKVQQLRAG
tara:strand:- start:4 stop:399 length:396 start_codon:yes stop_codon:yes gene_type:complete